MPRHHAIRPAIITCGRTYYGYTHGGDLTVEHLLLLVPATWLLIGLAIGVPCGVVVAWIVWRLSREWSARWMDLREDPK